MLHAATAAPAQELTDLKAMVDRCLRSRANLAFTSTDAGAGASITCSMRVGDALRTIEKLTYLEDTDNLLLFNIVESVLRQWRGMGVPTGTPDDHEVEIRRIAAQKLGEIGELSSDRAVMQLSAASRDETSSAVQLAIIAGLRKLIPRTAPNVRTEALTTLKILASPDQPVLDVYVLNAAREALKALAPTLEIGPVTVTSVPKPRSPYYVPIVATATTAVIATSALLLIFRPFRRRGLGAVGPLRRRAEAALRQRRGR